MSATTSAPVEASEKECSVCSEPFREPKLLPCGHLLCHQCVLSWLNKQKDASCPLCRCPIVDPKKYGSGKINFEEFAGSLPTDLAMKALVDADRILNKKHQCQVCEDVAATTICLNCMDCLCPACAKGHKKLSMSKHHVVEELSSLTPEKLSAMCLEEPCAVHVNESAKGFCPKHGTSVCILCATTDHRQCPEVMTLETKMAEAQKILQELVTALSQGEVLLEKGLSDLENHMRTVEQKTEAAIAEIEDTCNRLESAVKACRKRLKELMQGKCADVREAVNDGKGVLLRRKGKLSTHKKAVERAQKTSGSDKIHMTQVLQARIKELDDTVTLPTEIKDMKQINLAIDPHIVAHIQDLLQVNLDRRKWEVYKEKGPTLTFHPKSGNDVVLHDNGLTAEKKHTLEDSHGGLVVAQEEMYVNRMYEVYVEKLWYEQWEGMLPVGVLTASPETVPIPSSAFEPPWTEAIILVHDHVCVHGKKVPLKLGQALENMPSGSRVGLCLNDNRDLLLYRDGMLKGTIYAGVPSPAYPLFNLNQRYSKITALPVVIPK